MKKIVFTLLISCALAKASAQTGIGTITPNTSAKLDIYSTNKGFLPPRVSLTGAFDQSTIPSPATGLLVYCKGDGGLASGYYFWNGSAWATIATAGGSASNNYGDVKTGFQTADHNGWIKLNGRAKSTLSSTQQTQATALGIGSSLPNANNAFLVQNGTTIGSVSGSNSVSLSQNQLPNVTYTGSIIDVAHGAAIIASSSGVFSRINGSSWGNASGGGVTETFNLSIPLNGGVTQQPISITPVSLSVNTFIYLGY